MSDDKTEEPQGSQKLPDKDGSPDENPEVLKTIDITELDPSNFNWLREARKAREANKRTPTDVDEDTDK